MRTYALCIVEIVAVAVFLTVPASAQPYGEQILVGGQSQVCADTDAIPKGCPDQGGCCSANVDTSQQPPVLHVYCYQPPDGGEPIRGLAGGGDFYFNILAFDTKAQYGELEQTFGTDVSPANFITSGKAFVRSGAGGPVYAVEITQPNHFSSGMLCNQGGPAVVVQTEPNAPRMLFGLQNVDCSGCPSSPCVPDTQNPTHLKVTVPLRTTTGSLVTRDVFIAQQNGSLTSSLDSTSLGSIALGGLGSCVFPAAPTASEIGLVLLTLALLAAGAWALGRRPAFSESIPLP